MAGILRDITKVIGHHFAVQAFFNKKLSEYGVGLHAQPSIELFYVMEGSAHYTVTSPKGEHVREWLRSGDLILIDAETPHRLSIEKGCHGIYLELKNTPTDPDAVPAVDSYAALCNCDCLIKAFGSRNHVALSDFMFLKQTLWRLQTLLDSNKLGYADHYFTQTVIAEILLGINECYRKTYLTNPVIGKITEYIMRNYQENLTAAGIAAALDMNVTYLQKLFKKEMDSTLYEYITTFRLGQAISLMRNTNMKFADIAVESGFNSRQTFYNAFKEFTGYSPKTYKKFLALPATEFKSSQTKD